jgi:hypothetical protein
MTGITDDVDERFTADVSGDVIFSFLDVSNSHQLTTATLLQRLLVLAVTDLNRDSDVGTTFINELRARSDGLRNVTVHIELNGMPVPSRRFFAMLPIWMRSIAERTAHEAFGTLDGLADLRELIAEATDDIQERVDRLLVDAGVPRPERDD